MSSGSVRQAILENGVDIISLSSQRIEDLEDLYGVEYGEPEEVLYRDNCVANKAGICPRIRWCGGVDKV